MNSAPDLKTRNLWKLATLVAFNTVLFWVVYSTGELQVGSVAGILSDLDLRDGVLGLGLPTLVVVLNALLTSTGKARLVFWRFRHPLPGSRAFTQLGPRDPRVDLGALKARHGELPAEPDEQNRLWYKIFKKHETKPAVEGAHRGYLLTRDMVGLSALCLPGLGGAAFIVHPGLGTAGYLAFLVLQYLVLRQAAVNTGRSLVVNALAEEGVGQG